MNVPRDLDIFCPSTVKSRVRTRRSGAVAGEMQHGRPEQGVEIEDVFADEVVHLGLAVGFEVFVKIDTDAVAQVFKRRHVADGRVQPDVEVFAWRVGDSKPKYGASREMSQSDRVVSSPSPSHSFILLRASGCRWGLPSCGLLPEVHALRKSAHSPSLKKKCSDSRNFGFGTGNGGIRVDQFGRGIGRAADFAVVAVLVLGVAFGAFAFNEAVGQEHFVFQGRKAAR